MSKRAQRGLHPITGGKTVRELRAERRIREREEAEQRAERDRIWDAQFRAEDRERRAEQARREAEAQRRAEQERAEFLALHEERIATGWWKGPSA